MNCEKFEVRFAERGPEGKRGPQGEKGKDGENYVLTPEDKREIAAMVAELFENTEEEEWVE